MHTNMHTRRVFGNAGFREAQRQVMEAAVAGRDCFVLMPTGSGKSLCYQLPAVLARGVGGGQEGVWCICACVSCLSV